MRKLLFSLIVVLLMCSASEAAQRMTLSDGTDKELGTATNPLYITGATGSGEASAWLTDTGNVYLETSTLNVGIGTITPSGKLGVLGNITTTGTITSTGGLFATVLTAAQPNVTSVGTLTTLNVTGNTGIGTTSPGAALGINGDVSTTGNMQADTVTIGDGIKPGKISSEVGDVNIADSLSVSVDLTVMRNVTITGGLTISNVVSSSGAVYYAVINPTGGIERSSTYFNGGGGSTDWTDGTLAPSTDLSAGPLYAVYNGNVGIGVTNPKGKMEVSGHLRIAPSGGNGELHFGEGATNRAWLMGGYNTLSIYGSVGHLVEFFQCNGSPHYVDYGIAGTEDPLYTTRFKGRVGIGEGFAPSAIVDISPSAVLTTTDILRVRTLTTVDVIKVLANGNMIWNGPSGSTEPVNIEVGCIWLDTDDKTLKVK